MRRTPRQRGQAVLVIVILMGILLLAVLGLATDYSQLWAHRQMAQAAADAACQAGAADLFLASTSPDAATAYPSLNFGWIGGASFQCSSKPTSAPCAYVTANGYPASSATVSFPASVPGAPDITSWGVATPFIKVSIQEEVPLTLTRLVTSNTTAPISASAVCGVSPVAVPIPFVVLHRTASGALSVSGNAKIQVYGGPRRGVQIDSSSSTAFTPGGSSSRVDLTHGGPDGLGADFAVFGNETQPATVLLGSGKWVSPSTPYGDPWANIAAPSRPAFSGTVTSVGLGVNGCPDPDGCTEFSAGDYIGCSSGNGNLATGSKGCLDLPVSYTVTFPNWAAKTNYSVGAKIRPTSSNAGKYIFVATTPGITSDAAGAWPQVTGTTFTTGGVIWMNIGNPVDKPNTAIFDPGVYYLGAEGLKLGSNSTVRPSTALGDGSGGTTFYFSTTGTITVDANSGKTSGCSGNLKNCIVPYKPDGSTSSAALGSVASVALQCTNATANPPQVPSSVDGNILLGPCTGTYAAASNDGHEYRGFLFFQNRATAADAKWGGGGQFLLSGFMYFHNSGGYGSTLDLQGNSGAGAFALGNIVSDRITLGGTSGINMILNPAASYQILRPQMLK